ncbi:MAG: FAD-dependent oxidoreductase [Clostridia bacterium]|nr:FAD-dependent oxidoreductase [Clostridia bacterium]
MLRIINLCAGLNDDITEIKNRLEKQLGSKVNSVKIIKRAIDARKKNDVHYVLSVDATVEKEEYILRKNLPNVSIAKTEKYVFPVAEPKGKRPLIVGTGPAGLFCALYLSRTGFNPIVIERGADIDSRTKSIESYWSSGELDERTNVQFGEGGAGTFSDGKLNTGTKDIRISAVLEEFVVHGAKEDILVNNKPHIGTDILRNVVKNIRTEIIKNGGEVRFLTKLTDIKLENGRVVGAVVENADRKYEIETDKIVLAIGHSARDTFEMLKMRGIKMEQKPFSIGARIEHTQAFISSAMYGDAAKSLPPADYKLAVHLSNGRSLYTFCMCPGGYVVASASEKNTIVTNGMSYSDRSGNNANSAILVNVTPSDFESNDPLAGVYLQREIESRAYTIGAGKAPAETVGSFLGKTNTNAPRGAVIPTYKPQVTFTSLERVFPEFITASMRQGLILMDKRIHGFASDDAILTAPETRSSSPVRLLRNDNLELSAKGLFTAGEGGGHAGGITSSAVDGIKAAEAVLRL